MFKILFVAIESGLLKGSAAILKWCHFSSKYSFLIGVSENTD